MRLALISDVHANVEALSATLKAITRQDVDRIVCLGDVVGFNASPAECIDLLRAAKPVWIAGNHDRAVTGQIPVQGFSEAAARAIAWTRQHLSAEMLGLLAALPLKSSIGRHLVVVHGALHPDAGCELVRLDNDERRRRTFAALAKHPSAARVCAHGHVHRIGIFEQCEGVVREVEGDEAPLHLDARYLLCPGTVGEPRSDEWRATHMVLDTERSVVTVHRVEYDMRAARRRAHRAGLRPWSATLPPHLRRAVKRLARAAGLYDTLKQRGI